MDKELLELAAKACGLAQPEQEPTPWRDMVVVSLVREGINKHRARELADHFAAQPVQKPWGACVSGRVFVGALPDHVRKLTEDDGRPIQLLYTTPSAPQRPWQGLTEENFVAINQSCITKLQAATSAESILMEKNT